MSRLRSGDHESSKDSTDTLHHDLHHERGTVEDARRAQNGIESQFKMESEPQESTVGFLHKSLRPTWLKVFVRYWLMLAFLCTFILGVLSLYWGALYNAEMNLNSFIVYIVNFETEPDAIIGPTLVRLSEAMVKTNQLPHLGYVTVPPSSFNNNPLEVREAIFQEQAWAAMIVNPNATSLLRQAVDIGNSSFDPLGTCQQIYVQARDQDAYATYIIPQLNMLQTQFTAAVGTQWAQQVFSNASITRDNLQRVPQAISPAVGFSVFNLRPFSPAHATPTVTVGLIYLIILSFFAYSFFMPIHQLLITPKEHPPLHFWQHVTWRWLSAINSYLYLSLAFSLVSLAFQIPFSNSSASHLEVAMNPNPYGKATFIVYWMLNFIGMIALGLACENVSMVIGFPWTAMWLLFWVITNVSTSFYPMELEPHFFYWGYAWPLHNVVEGGRTLLFDKHSRLGLNFGVLFAWAGVNTLLFPACSYFMRWKEERRNKKEE